MLVVAGGNFYGKVDQVPGLLHVVTPFAHIQFFPTVPANHSLIILEKAIDNLPRRVQIARSWKSILVAWARPLLVIAGSILAAIGASEYIQPKIDHQFALTFLVPGLLLIGVFWLTYQLTRASAARAVELARLANVPDNEIMIALARIDPYYSDRLEIVSNIRGSAPDIKDKK